MRNIVGMLTLALAAMPASADVALLNGGFTDGTDNDPDVWVENSLALSCRHTWGSHDAGGYLMGLNGWAGGAGTYAEFHQDVTGVRPRYRYTLNVQVEGDDKYNGSNVFARLIWMDGALTPLSSVSTNLDAQAIQWGWKTITLQGVSPAGANRLRVQFDAESAASGGDGAVKFDALTLTRAAIPATIIKVR